MSGDIDQFFQHIFQGYKASQVTQQLAGRQLGLSWGIVTNANDPLKLGRVQVTTASLGGQSTTNWLVRVMPWKFLSVPIPEIGDLVLIGYPDGNANGDGYYLGFAQNLLNPAEVTGKALTYLWEAVQLVINQEGILLQLGDVKVLLKYDEYLELGWLLSKITIFKTKIEIVSPNITMGTSPTTLTDIANWNSSAIDFKADSVRIKGIEVCRLGGHDDEGDEFVDSGQ